tara:strand:- start:622 stop:1020 length:399 start_codon:yes stop_codon:yes gene_type:complete
MAELNLNIKLTSSDLTTDSLSIDADMTISSLNVGGLAKRVALKVTGVDHEELVEENHYQEGAVVYVNNTGTVTGAAGMISLEVGGKIIVSLAAGEWALFPWSAGQSGDDINVSAGTAGNLLEWGVFGTKPTT